MAHFQRGLGFPLSDFMVQFMQKFGILPHHLPANASVHLSTFVFFTEGYLGVWPSINLFCKYFSLRRQSVPNPDEGRVSPAASQSPPPYIMMFGQIPVAMPPAEEVKPNFRTPPAKEMPEANRIIQS
jgi:hypothetical protein